MIVASWPTNRKKNMNKFKGLIKINEAASLLGVSASTLRNWELAGKITVYRHPINSYRLFDRVEIEKRMSNFRENNDDRNNQDCQTRSQEIP